jgi:DNA-binding transcriptional LysR family regulator
MALFAGREGLFGMEIHQLRYLLAVDATSNFTRATERWNVS